MPLFLPSILSQRGQADTGKLLYLRIELVEMQEGNSFLARRASFFQPSPIQQLSRLAQARHAINLAEGYPDFPAPQNIKQAAVQAICADFNQYRHVQALSEKVAELFSKIQGVQVDSLNITICCGQSEAFAASVMAVVDLGDEVLLLDPAYETYEACIILAGGIPVYVTMEPPYWSIDMDKLEASVSSQTKAIVVNSPHNPTGKVFNMQELSDIAALCHKYNLLAITDELTYVKSAKCLQSWAYQYHYCGSQASPAQF